MCYDYYKGKKMREIKEKISGVISFSKEYRFVSGMITGTIITGGIAFFIAVII
jgi:hypothetical protein